ncbi:hypothetical protein BDN72DRAFT_867345 [Pluteus cervinus]|uniref:Uncharacterized protein n=1 Tax=Pluteus cervinus TaxID=181527 RepID=A0ACD3BEI7_9AGAR|nr:hypothetical protein BDN72DRAFT_867345 [Pluteus cervinus]
MRMLTSAAESSTPQIPRPSASLVVVNDHNEILLVHRNPKARFFAGVHVFPGGNYDSEQDDSFGITAIRETFEESGILLATSTTGVMPPDSVLEVARRAIHSRKMTFKSFLEEHKLKPNVDSLLPFTEWITPPNAPRRFHTKFFVTFLSDTATSKFSSGTKEAQIPTPDGGQEVISARYISPRAALKEFDEKKITFMPPQFYILTTLSEIMEQTSHRDLIQTLSRGPFGRMVINPRRLFSEKEDGHTILTYEGDESRGGPKGRLHRASVKVGKGGITEQITLLRNFDILTEVEIPAHSRL